MNTPPRTPRTPQLAPRLYNRRNEVSPPSVIRTRPRFARLEVNLILVVQVAYAWIKN